MRSLFFSLSLFLSISISAQYISSVTVPDKSTAVITDTTDLSVMLANSITQEDLSRHLHVLASDEYEGRETGEKGIDLAASYIATYFKNLGLPAKGLENTYFQSVAFNKTQWKKNAITVNKKGYKHLWDYLAFASLNEHNPYYTPGEVIFLGYGIDDKKYSDYKGNNLKGKAIMINEGEPIDKLGKSYISGTTEKSDWSRACLYYL